MSVMRPLLTFATIFLFAVRLAASAGAQSPDQVRGVVYLDQNENGRRDSGEGGIPDVAVSDQDTVVRSDRDGTFSFPAGRGHGVVFITVPDGFKSVGLFWRRAGQVGEGFGLAKTPAVTAFTFLHASDTHVSAPTVGRMRRLGAIIDSVAPAFVLITGDLVRDALRVGEAEASGYYQLFLQEKSTYTAPVWTVPGNHENFGIERHLSLVSPANPMYGKAMYRDRLGPDYYSFNYGGVHFVGLNTVDIDDLWYYGHVDSLQLAWLARDLSVVPAEMPVVTFNHIPFFQTSDQLEGPVDDGPAPTLIRVGGRTLFRHVVSNGSDVLSVLRKHQHVLALGGHIHKVERIEYERDGVATRFATAAAVIGGVTAGAQSFPSGATLYRVKDGKIDGGAFLRMDPPK